MHILSSILFAVTANIDSIAVSVSYGAKKIKIGFASNLLISAVSALGTLLSMTIGLLISDVVTPFAANVIGSGVLILLGLWFTIDSLRKLHARPEAACQGGVHLTGDKKEKAANALIEAYQNSMELLDEPELADKDQSGRIDLREAVSLAFALAVNNFAAGIGASMSGLNIEVTTLSTFLLNLAFVEVGCLIGAGCLSRFVGRYSSLISGLFIILLGICELFI